MTLVLLPCLAVSACDQPITKNVGSQGCTWFLRNEIEQNSSLQLEMACLYPKRSFSTDSHGRVWLTSLVMTLKQLTVDLASLACVVVSVFFLLVYVSAMAGKAGSQGRMSTLQFRYRNNSR